jgi:hypothetical protein
MMDNQTIDGNIRLESRDLTIELNPLGWVTPQSLTENQSDKKPYFVVIQIIPRWPQSAKSRSLRRGRTVSLPFWIW